jgi:hypothetical protein
MEGMLLELEVGLGICVTTLAFVVLAFGGILVGYLSDLEKAGKRFFWTEAPVPGPEMRMFLPRDVEIPHPV